MILFVSYFLPSRPVSSRLGKGAREYFPLLLLLLLLLPSPDVLFKPVSFRSLTVYGGRILGSRKWQSTSFAVCFSSILSSASQAPNKLGQERKTKPNALHLAKCLDMIPFVVFCTPARMVVNFVFTLKPTVVVRSIRNVLAAN